MKAIIVGVKLDNDNLDKFNEEMEELEKLANACEIEVLDKVYQELPDFNPKTYVGKGKVQEIKEFSEALECDVVIFNDELTPVQIANLDAAIEKLIYDRTYLILEIFKRRARTKEAILQVELASLSYLLPRLSDLRNGLSRQRGAGGGYAHGRGAGETKLELDRRITNDKIAQIKKELKELTNKRKQQRLKRNKATEHLVALVGYTNSGKSSLMNALMRNDNKHETKDVMEKDMLFATLETATRKVSTSFGNFILTDTVGFISKLPHMLVEAFKSTLEEIKEADLLIHVVDASNDKFLDQISTTNKVLEEIGVKDIPIIYAFNKIDKVDGYLFIPREYPDAIRISATKDININVLIKKVVSELYKDYIDYTFIIPYDKQNDLYKIKDYTINSLVTYEDNYIVLNCKGPDYLKEKYQEYIKKEA